ncbi:PAS domain S-box protein [Thermodesulfobacteriota bacterium]
MEDELIKHSDYLEKMIAERTASLKKSNEDLQQEITDRKKAEEALRKSEKRFRRLVEYSPDSLILHDPEGNIVDVNERACESLGYKREELINLSINDIEQEFSKHLENWKRLVPGVPETFEGTQKRKDGTTFPVEIRLWIFEPGEHELILALVRDITGRMHAEEEKKKLEAQLAYAQKIQAIGTLAGGIAHNFNNLLMGIQGNVALMFFDKQPEDPDYTKLENIQKMIDNGAKLTSQLLGYAREGRYEVRPISLNKLLKETSEIFLSTRKNILIRYDLTNNLYGIKADQGQIEQTLLNLFINAADAMPGGGTLYLKTSNVSHEDIVGKSYSPGPGTYVMLTVRDTGIGMDKIIMDRIFEPFFTTKGLAQGTGLGLASAYGVIKGHRGYIDVDSEKGRGTTFTIYLPATAEAVREEKELPDEILKGNETVLLVDDEEIVLEAGELMLTTMGYNVYSAASGREALKIYEKNHDKIDIVLIDMVMPEMGGGETYDRIKDINPDAKVILSSGYSLDGEAKEILERGCSSFIQKPFNMKELSCYLRDILDY